MTKKSKYGVNDSNIITQKVIDGKRVFHPGYLKWRNMIQRCAVGKGHYANVSVCPDWQYLSKFLEWIRDKDISRLYLDKDIVGDGSLYSPETCAFVTQECNQFFSSVKKLGKFMIGVSQEKRHSNLFYCHYRGDYVGCYLTEEESHRAWQKEKLKHAESLAISEQDVRVKEILRQVAAKIKKDILKGGETCSLTLMTWWKKV